MNDYNSEDTVELSIAEQVKQDNTKKFQNKMRRSNGGAEVKKIKDPVQFVRKAVSYQGIRIKGCSVEDLDLDEE